MFARHLSLSLYLDNLFGVSLLLGGTALGGATALHFLPLEAGIFGVIVFGYGKLLCVGAMLRTLEAREIRAFQLGKQAEMHSLN
jgi:hypothetical protein